MDLRITGAGQINSMVRHLRAADKGLARQMGAALNRAVDPLRQAIADEAGKAVPRGYAPVLTRSLKHRRSLRTGGRQASLKFVTHATGELERRDLPSINAGSLRHPVFGRFRRTRLGMRKNPWSTTSVRGGFFERGTERAGADAERELLKVLDDFADRLSKG